jgi:hypothetical protein
MAYRSLYSTTASTQTASKAVVSRYKPLFEEQPKEPEKKGFVFDTMEDVRTLEAKKLMNQIIQPEVKQGVIANLPGAIKDTLVSFGKGILNLPKKITESVKKQSKAFTAPLGLQAGITEETLQADAPKDRLATAGVLAGMAFPSKGIGMISEGIPGARGLSNLLSKGKDVKKTVEETTNALKDTVYQELKNLANKSEEFVQGGKLNLDDFDEVQTLIKTLEKEKAPNPETIRQGSELLKLHGTDVTLPKAVQVKPLAQEAGKIEQTIVQEVKPVVKEAVEQVTKERKYITSIKEELPSLKVAGQYIPRANDNLAQTALKAINDDWAKAELRATTEISDEGVAIADNILGILNKKISQTTDQALKSALEDKAAAIASDAARNLTEAGRTVQAASLLGKLTPEGQVKFAAREIQKFNTTAPISKKIPELTGEQAGKILKDMNAIKEMPAGVEKGIEFKKLQNYISSLIPSPFYKKWIAVWKAGLLTGIKTSGLNINANLSHATGAEIIKDIPAAIADKILSLFTGKRTLVFNTKGTIEGFKEGVGKGWRYLRTGFDERDIGTKLDIGNVNFGKGTIAKALQKYTDTVFKLMGTEDQPFYYASKLRSLYGQAKAQAINKGLKGKEAQTFIDGLIQNPTPEMVKYATTDAEVAVFQNTTRLAKAAGALVREVPAAEIILPFRKTPSAVAMQILDYSPVGFARALWQVKKSGFDQRLFSQAIGRGMTGTAVLALGAYLGKKGLVNTSRPTGEKEQKLWEQEGRIPNSIKINGKYRQVQALGPLGPSLLIGASFQKAFDEAGTPSGAIAQGLADSVQSFSQQTYLTGVSNFIDAVSDPARSAKSVAGSTLASVVPTIVSDVARATDEKERRAETIFDKLQARIPGVREGLEPQVDVLGRERESVGNPLEIMADPTRPSPQQSSPVTSELRRLWDKGVKVSPTALGDKAGYKGLTPQQNTEIWKKAGEIVSSKLTNLFNSEEYQKLDDEKKGKIVDNFVSKSNTVARVGMVIELTQGLKGEELKKKLSELKATGLMTQDVFNAYLELR